MTIVRRDVTDPVVEKNIFNTPSSRSGQGCLHTFPTFIFKKGMETILDEIINKYHGSWSPLKLSFLKEWMVTLRKKIQNSLVLQSFTEERFGLPRRFYCF